MRLLHRMSIGSKRTSVKPKISKKSDNTGDSPEIDNDCNPCPTVPLPAERTGGFSTANMHTPKTGSDTLIFDTQPSECDEKLEGSDSETNTGHILIGIDFGTTYSGVAWAYSKQPDDIKIITDWDCTEFQNADKGKAPTKIAYEHSHPDSPIDGHGSGTAVQATWGYGVEGAEAVEWFKLLLLDDKDLAISKRDSPQIEKARQLLKRAGKTPVEAVTDYLRLLWNHAIANIEKDFSSIVVEGLPFQVVCTVPAVWTTQAVDRMRQAAKDAGIVSHRLAGETTLHFVSEPEAAALATLDDLKARPNFKKDDTFVVCDAGGGTVDLISYKVIETNPMILAECVEGKGQLCGAVFMDQDFEALMEQLVGEAWDVPASAVKDMMNAQWENGIKRGFNGQTKDWKIRLPHECIKKGAPPVITLNQGHVREIFDNVVSQIQMLVNDQISVVQKTEGKLPKAVVLVGGFGSCRYLYNLLKLENEHRKIDVYQSTGTKPWTSISRGAVLKALTNSLLPGPIVLSRILRCSYGTRYHTLFDPKVHQPGDRYWYEMRGLWYAKNQMEWYLHKGDKIFEKKPHSLPWRESVRTKGKNDMATLATSIYTCDSSDPPSRRTDEVKQSCIIETVRPIDMSGIREQTGVDGEGFKEVHYELEVNVIGIALEFVMKYQGERVGHSSVQAEVQDAVSTAPFPLPVASETSLSRVDVNLVAATERPQHAVVMQDYTAKNGEEHSIMRGEWVGLNNAYAREGWLYIEKNGLVRAVPEDCIHPL